MEIRTTCPNNNKYYITTGQGGWNKAIQGKPTKAGANVLANCVGYANGRFAEIIGKNAIEYQFICNAENFIEKAKGYGLSVSNVPTLGGIMVWEGKGSLAGHVAIVERIDSNNQIFTSESAYNGSAFYNKTRYNCNGNWDMGSNYSFRGCIVNPSNPEPTPTPTHKIAEDGIWGVDTTRKAQEVFGTFVDGRVSNQYAYYKRMNPGLLSSTFDWKTNPKGGSNLIYAIQKWCGTSADGFIGTNTIKAMQRKLGTPVDGKVSYPSMMVKAFQKYLNER